jgi:lysylphosphatidylglycerol synthetase-like protein (DUF2156 family)
MKKIRKVIMLTLATVMTFGLVAFSGMQKALAYKCPDGTPGADRGDVSSLAECSISETEDTFIPTLTTIINVILGVLGLVAVIMIIMGGVTYVTSSGDTVKLTKAKNTIIYSVIGLVIALLAFAIVNFVLQNVFPVKDDKNPPETEDVGLVLRR